MQKQVIVAGALNTDIVAQEVDKLLLPGELTYGKSLQIGPGGKSRNIAQMIAALTGKNTVSMIGKTSKDPYGLWKAPLESLKKAHVNTKFIEILDYKKTGKFPGVALIAVDRKGNNQIYVLPGITQDFLPQDINKARDLFDKVGKAEGLFVVTLEMPLKTVIHAIKEANKRKIKVFLDPGGIMEGENYKELLEQKLFLLKPNEHEIKILTGIRVTDFKSAKRAAEKLLKKNIENVFVTMGSKGGYLFNKESSLHISIPKIKKSSVRDATGCGDQTIAAFASAILNGSDIEDAAKIAIKAGAIEFGKAGILPVTSEELYK